MFNKNQNKTEEELYEDDIKRKQLRTHIAYILILINMVVWSFATYQARNFYNSYSELLIQSLSKRQVTEVKAAEYEPKTIQEKIEMSALEAGIDVEEALEVAKCESRFDPKAKSKTSTAKGLYQFINSTWAENCTGDVLNEDDNIACFMSYYPKHKSQWECAKLLGYTK